ncbi:hypothetical protein ZWY2020_032320 [Hordeum vulgare]|nr:hypothetical protein ZWY2020_032320 [Hordeum vulgare]
MFVCTQQFKEAVGLTGSIPREPRSAPIPRIIWRPPNTLHCTRGRPQVEARVSRLRLPSSSAAAERTTCDDRARYADLNLEINYDNVGSLVKPARDENEISTFLETYRKIKNRDSDNQLQHDLIEHRCQLYGGR